MHDLAALALDHPSHYRLRDDERRRQVGRDDLVPLLEWKFGERPAPLDAGIIEQDVDVPVFGFDPRDTRTNSVAIGYVEDCGRRIKVLIAQSLGGDIELILLAAVEHNLGACAREALCDREAKSAIRAGDERDL